MNSSDFEVTQFGQYFMTQQRNVTPPRCILAGCPVKMSCEFQTALCAQVSAIVAPGTAGWAQRLSMAVDAVMLDQTSTRLLDT